MTDPADDPSPADPDDVTRLVVIRHAEPKAHVEGVIPGPQGDTGLSDLGVRQAEALRDRLAITNELDGVGALVTSPLPRARETAEIIAPAIGPGLDLDIDPEVEEWRFGDADGLTWDEFADRHPIPETGWHPYLHRAAGDESWAEFQVRAQRRLHELTIEHRDTTVVVVCHGGVIGASMVSMAGLGHFGGGVWLRPDYVSLTEWSLRSRDAARFGLPKWHLVRFNDSAHTNGLDTGVIHPLP
ncbi:MAG TPA: histidine phosphatase family protein [Acidimicrobiales bacterium]